MKLQPTLPNNDTSNMLCVHLTCVRTHSFKGADSSAHDPAVSYNLTIYTNCPSRLRHQHNDGFFKKCNFLKMHQKRFAST